MYDASTSTADYAAPPPKAAATRPAGPGVPTDAEIKQFGLVGHHRDGRYFEDVHNEYGAGRGGWWFRMDDGTRRVYGHGGGYKRPRH